VTVLSRSGAKVARQFGRKVKAISRLTDLPDAGQFDAVVNLAGAGIFDRRWTSARKQVLLDSRIKLTDQLVMWMSDSNHPPGVFISGSAIGYYGDHGSQVLDENSPSNPDFAQQLCADWESAALMAESTGTRVCLIRTGLVLGRGGGILQRMLLPFRLGLGGNMGNGRQWMSWIHIADWVGAVQTMITDTNMKGPYNATAPEPVTNQAFSEMLAKRLRRPMLLPLPASLLRLLLGEMAELILGSQRVLPQRLLLAGFQFRYSHLDAALHEILTSAG